MNGRGQISWWITYKVKFIGRRRGLVVIALDCEAEGSEFESGSRLLFYSFSAKPKNKWTQRHEAQRQEEWRTRREVWIHEWKHVWIRCEGEGGSGESSREDRQADITNGYDGLNLRASPWGWWIRSTSWSECFPTCVLNNLCPRLNYTEKYHLNNTDKFNK